MVQQRRVEADQRRLLAAVLGARAREGTADLANQRPVEPQVARPIEEVAHLGTHVAKSRRGAEDDRVGLGQLGRLGDGNVGEHLAGLRGAAGPQRLVGHQFGNLREADLGAGHRFRATHDGLGQLVDVAVHAVEHNLNLCHRFLPCLVQMLSSLADFAAEQTS